MGHVAYKPWQLLIKSIEQTYFVCSGAVRQKKMAEAEVTFHNKIKIKVQAQIFSGRTLISTCVAEPGEACILTAGPARFDIYCKNGATGWELAHKLDSEAKVFTLSLQNGRYVIA